MALSPPPTLVTSVFAVGLALFSSPLFSYLQLPPAAAAAVREDERTRQHASYCYCSCCWPPQFEQRTGSAADAVAPHLSSSEDRREERKKRKLLLDCLFSLLSGALFMS